MIARSSRCLIALAVLALPASVAAQAFHISAGPARRDVSVERFYGPPRAWDAVSLDASWAPALSSRFRVLLGGGVTAASAVTAEYAYPAPDALAPCLPDVQCAPPASETVVSGGLTHLRAGLAFEEGWTFIGAGVVTARSTDGERRAGTGTFVELRLRPFASLRQVSLGVLAYRLSPAPGNQRALLMPTLGIRF